MLIQPRCAADRIGTAEELLCGAAFRIEPDDGQKWSFSDSLDLKMSSRDGVS